MATRRRGKPQGAVFTPAPAGERCRVTRSASGESTRRTVLIAGAANVIVAVAKLAAGLLTGSSAMLAEAAHSLADTMNQAFLLTSLRRGNRPADERHPFGYGQERYFWSLLAAFGIFIAGAGFSVFEGLLTLRHGGGHSFAVAYVVLAVSFAAEGTSLVRAYRQVSGEARSSNTQLIEHVRGSRDTTVKAALFEDSAAVVGLVLAAGGLVLQQLTGSPVWDGGASIAIGVLLVVVAVRLGLDSAGLLIGESADPRVLQMIREEICATPGIDDVLDLLTMHLGPDQLIVAARVALDDEISADRAEDLADEIDRRLGEKLPVTPHVFIDPTQTAPAGRVGSQ
jgi:cation diffusion facilitator family transporter